MISQYDPVNVFLRFFWGGRNYHIYMNDVLLIVIRFDTWASKSTVGGSVCGEEGGGGGGRVGGDGVECMRTYFGDVSSLT